MRKLALSVALLAALACGACKCAAERNAVVQIEATHEKVAKRLLEYVEKDASLNAAAKDDWKKLVESDRRNIEALKRALGD
jgi:hypothetical protein